MTRQHAGKRVGYVRVSTTEQNPARQYEAIGEVDRVFEDRVSGGSRADRVQLAAMIDYIRDDDVVVVVASMDRLARSTLDLFQLVDEILTKGASITFIKEGQSFTPDKTDPMSRLMLGVLGSVAEFERAIIRERQAEGIRLAKAAGKYKGRARALTDTQLQQARDRINAGVPKAVVARDLGINRSTLYRAREQQQGRF